jgi:acyl-CoA thioester hydrolase
VTVFRSQAITRSTDIDGDGIVNNAVYFQLQEEGRVQLLAELAMLTGDQKDGDYARTFTVAETACRFYQPVFWPARLEIETRVTQVGRSSFRLEYHIFDADAKELRSEGYSAQVWLDAEALPTPIPEAGRRHLEAAVEESIMRKPWGSATPVPVPAKGA